MLADEIKEIMDFSMKNHEVPFSSIAISKDNEIVLKYQNGGLNGDELYFLYSTSKPITCTAALQLLEKGLIKLDDYLYEYIPEYKDMKVKKDGGITDAKTHITLRHLFTMTSGMNYDIKSESIKNIIEKSPDASTMDIIRAIANEPLEFEPGSHWKYGLSHDVLAGVIEVVSGMSFGEYLKKNIFDVCEMKNSYLSYNSTMNICDQFRWDAIKNHVVPMEKENSYILTPKYESGGAGIISTVDDYIKFAQTLINSEKLLKKETLDMMCTPQLDEIPYIEFSNSKKGYTYGLGVRVNETGAFSAKGEFGWDGAAGAYALFDAKNKIAVFYAMHIRDYGDYQYNDLHIKLRDCVYKNLLY